MPTIIAVIGPRVWLNGSIRDAAVITLRGIPATRIFFDAHENKIHDTKEKTIANVITVTLLTVNPSTITWLLMPKSNPLIQGISTRNIATIINSLVFIVNLHNQLF
jgi:hypothetical protein